MRNWETHPDQTADIRNTVASYRCDEHADEGFRFMHLGTSSFSILERLAVSLEAITGMSLPHYFNELIERNSS